MWNTHAVAANAKTLLQQYLPAYIALIERRNGIPTRYLPMPGERDYIAAAQEDTQTPGYGNTRIFVICPGLADAPEETPEGGYTAPYALMVGVEVQNRRNREEVDSHLGYYQEAIRDCILREGYKCFDQSVIDWTDENTDSGDTSMALTQGAGITTFAIYLNDVVSDRASLFVNPPVDPYEPEEYVAEPIDEFTYDVFATPINESLDS